MLNAETTYETSKSVIMVQNKLYSPFYAGPGKWVIYNPKNKKAYLAIGKDRVPDIVEKLVSYSSEKKSYHNFDDKINKLINSGLLLETENEFGSFENFIEHFQLACFDYPFKDYHEEDWLEKDVKKMDHYDSLWPQPPKFTQRKGHALNLPNVSITDLFKSPDTLQYIIALFKYCFGEINKIKGQFDCNVRKSSPSGGAKHPAEVVLCLKNNIGGLERGFYVYDAKNHKLISEYNYSLDELDNIEGDYGFLTRLRVERPMWRYREVRSFRAIFLDLGHVIKNIQEILGAVGYKMIIKPPIVNDKNYAWIKEPEALLIDVIRSKEYSDDENNINQKSIHQNKLISNEKHLITNPAIYFTFRNGNLIANNLWPKSQKAKVSLDEFMILTYCLPSRRGDRETYPAGILDALPNATPNSIQKLKENNLVLPQSHGKKLYKELALWTMHGWYLNFLTYLEMKNSLSYMRGIKMSKGELSLHIDLYKSLLNRKTTRKFQHNYQLKLNDFHHILNRLIADVDLNNTKVYINILNIEGIDEGFYTIDKSGELEWIKKSVNRAQIRELIIGQKWASDGCFQIIMVKETKLSIPYRQMLDLLELGMYGQTIYLTATDVQLGVFATPAVKDSQINCTLEMKNPINSLIYFLTIGKEDL